MISKRGSPYLHDKRESLVHLRIPQYRKGMVEGVDYSTRIKCNNGNYHILYTDDLREVTCPICKEKP
jgi:hypothetical protein